MVVVIAEIVEIFLENNLVIFNHNVAIHAFFLHRCPEAHFLALIVIGEVFNIVGAAFFQRMRHQPARHHHARQNGEVAQRPTNVLWVAPSA